MKKTLQCKIWTDVTAYGTTYGTLIHWIQYTDTLHMVHWYMHMVHWFTAYGAYGTLIHCICVHWYTAYGAYGTLHMVHMVHRYTAYGTLIHWYSLCHITDKLAIQIVAIVNVLQIMSQLLLLENLSTHV